MKRLGSACDAFAAWMEAKAPVCLLLCAWVYFAATAIRAQHRVFWYDELLTVNLCALPRFADVWAAVRTGIDLNPPFQFLAVRASQALFGAGQLSARLPVVLSFLAMSVFVFLYLRRRVSAGWALAGMMLPWLTEAYRFALDARPYGILLGCAAAALYCWSRAADPSAARRGPAIVGLAVSLSLALLTHCYAVLLAVPLVAGEGVRLRRRRRADWSLWIAMAAAAFPVILYPWLMSANHTPPVLATSPFHVTPWTAPGTYRELLDPAFWPLTLVILIVALAVRGADRPAEDDPHAMPAHESAALWGFAAIPIFAVLLAAATTGTFSLRYGAPGVIGLACLLAAAGARYSRYPARSGAAAAALFFVFFTSAFAGQLWTAIHPTNVHAATATSAPAPARVPDTPAVQVPGRPLFSLASGSRLPIVVASGLVFLEVDHYGDDALVARTYYLTDTEAALRHTGSAGFEPTYPTMKRLLHLRANVAPAESFLAERRPFLMYTTGYFVEWLLPELLERGWHVRLLGKAGVEEMSEVTPPR
jgi:hypothetical protein